MRNLFLALFAKRAVKYYLAGNDAPKDPLATTSTAIVSVKPKVLAERLQMALEIDVRIKLSHLSIPILCLLTKNDRLVNNDDMEKAFHDHANFAQQFFDSPQFILQRKPQEAIARIQEFLKSVELS